MAGNYQSATFADDSGTSIVKRVAGRVQKSDDNGQTFGDLGGPLDQMRQTRATLYALTGLDPLRSQGFEHLFDTLNGWTVESMSAAGQVGANSPVAVTDWDGHVSISAGGAGTDSISRGFTRNIAGTITTQNGRPIILDQNTPCAFAFAFQIPADSGSYILGGFSDPTQTGVGPKGAYVGFEHGTNARFFQGYKTNTGAGVGVDTVASTVQLDGDWHVGILICDPIAGAYKVRVDNEPLLSLPNTNPFPSGGLLACPRICFATAGPRVSWCTAIWPGSL
jgi:hypothetical protein